MVWTYYPNGYILSSLVDRHGYEACILRYFEINDEDLTFFQKFKRFLHIQTRFASSEFLDEGELILPQDWKEKPEGTMLCFRNITLEQLNKLTDFVRSLPTPKDLTVEITGVSYSFGDNSVIKWKVKKDG